MDFHKKRTKKEKKRWSVMLKSIVIGIKWIISRPIFRYCNIGWILSFATNSIATTINALLSLKLECTKQWNLFAQSHQISPFYPLRLITESSFSTKSPAQIAGYSLASGDSAKCPKGFNTASEAIWANNCNKKHSV